MFYLINNTKCLVIYDKISWPRYVVQCTCSNYFKAFSNMSCWLVLGELLDAGTSAWQQFDVISDILMILVSHCIIERVALHLCLQIYRDAGDQDDLFKASIGVFVSMPILVALIAALITSKDDKNPCASIFLWLIPFTALAFIFNALTPLGKLSDFDI